MKTRPAAVAGMFYPAEPAALERAVAELLANAPAAHDGAKAIIAPHAGYVYSGPTAACAYRLVESRRGRIRRVVLIGPAHRVYLQGVALPSVDAFATPLGDVAIDTNAVQQALALPGVQILDEAHAAEHSLEVHLPFLQTVLDDFRLVPIVVGTCPADEVQAVLELLWGGDETLIVASSDLSHFHSYDEARQIDAHTTTRIEARETTLRGEEACGAYVLNGLMQAASTRGLKVRTLDVRNSGDTAGDRLRVVGYGAYALN
ncbi:MAG: AmmeMemoRadiSam system protein B [Woeseiaceae bacterium]|nr:AmmeMemoRadiSam system protein B [Woeseiaceae bacterium]